MNAESVRNADHLILPRRITRFCDDIADTQERPNLVFSTDRDYIGLYRRRRDYRAHIHPYGDGY